MKFEDIVTTSKAIVKGTYEPYAAIFWTGGKDSTVMLHLIQEAIGFPLPNPIVMLDSGVEFPEIYEFVEKYRKEWRLDLHIFHYDAPTATEARYNKIKALQESIDTMGLKKIYVAIRKDESKARGKEGFLSPREDHLRVHPIINFTIDDIWTYIKKNKVPYCSLYDQGYKSLGEKPFTKPTKGNERSGRDAEKERIMKLLRKMGYF